MSSDDETTPKPGIGSTKVEVKISPTDITRPSITILSAPSSFTGTPLSMSKANWRDWKWDIEGALGLTGLWDYILGHIPCPKADHEPRAHRNWKSNDRVARFYIDSAMDRDEARALNVRDLQPATLLWKTLKDKYETAGAVSQFMLLEQVFHTELEDGENLLKSFNSAVDLASQAYGSKLTRNTFQVLALTRMISHIPSLSHIKSTIHSELHRAAKDGNRDTYTIDDIRSLITQRQTEITSQKHRQPETALSTTPAKKSVRAPVICENCNGRHHTKKYCINEGGGMHGSTVEQSKEAKRKDREAAEQAKGKKNEAHITTPAPATANFASRAAHRDRRYGSTGTVAGCPYRTVDNF
ncbi:hypothetical protein BJ165DRAFT_1405734 [Panaeolus papilionaceus]|nr:hypothetical protein BJ165DRAFT_1405734 [Panaeolus papilionaceus]